ncbi:hypothetical protein HG530_005732 [Fusarium avenaceum]|nr:hypothetical protein HG530_005732 [Fusarium avenaceum]
MSMEKRIALVVALEGVKDSLRGHGGAQRDETARKQFSVDGNVGVGAEKGRRRKPSQSVQAGENLVEDYGESRPREWVWCVTVAEENALDVAFILSVLLRLKPRLDIKNFRDGFEMRILSEVTAKAFGHLDNPFSLDALDGGIVKPVSLALVPFDLFVVDTRFSAVHCANCISVITSLESKNMNIIIRSPTISEPCSSQSHLDRNLTARASIIRVKHPREPWVLRSLQKHLG